MFESLLELALGVVFGLALVAGLKHYLSADLLEKINKPYTQYETAQRLLKERAKPIRPDVEQECRVCGMDDEPVLQMYSPLLVNWVCFFCAELQLLRLHLKNNGIRRFKNV